MGYSLNKTCYPDTASALIAFQQQFPYMDNGKVYFEGVASTINGTGLVSYRLDSKTGNTVTAGVASTIQLPSCTTEFLGAYPLQDIAFACTFILVWALGVNGGLKR